jgi:hypothetical protein
MGNAEGVYELIAQALAEVPSLTPTPDPFPSEGGGRPRLRKQRSGLKNLSARTGDSS